LNSEMNFQLKLRTRFNMINALLLSNSTMPGTSFFTWAKPWVKDFFADTGNLVFLPYAAVTFSYDEYSSKVSEVFQELGLTISSVHTAKELRQTIEEADGIVVGGGNTFALLNQLYRNDCLDVIRRKVAGGTPYAGWSAGANLACPTIMTTNDMPVVQPPSFGALGLVPFQVNPHYHELKFEGQGGETRRERLEEFLVLNPDKVVIGLPEGMLLHRNGGNLTLRGAGTARLYRAGKDVEDLVAENDLSFLLG
jgi:dipeptidase E